MDLSPNPTSDALSEDLEQDNEILTAPLSILIKWFPVHKASIRIEREHGIQIGAGMPWYLIIISMVTSMEVMLVMLLHLGTHAEPRTLGDIN